jgi:hypothetical protein
MDRKKIMILPQKLDTGLSHFLADVKQQKCYGLRRRFFMFEV